MLPPLCPQIICTRPKKKMNKLTLKRANKSSAEMRGASQTFFGSAWTEIIASNVND